MISLTSWIQNIIFIIITPVFTDVVVLLFKVREAYKTYMKTIAKYLGGGSDSDEQMMKVFEFESKLAMVS